MKVSLILTYPFVPSILTRNTLDITVAETGVTRIKVKHRPRLLSDNGRAFIADALVEYLKPYQMLHIHSRPYHPQTQGKIERYHRSMKSIVKLDTFYFPWELEQAIANFVAYHNYQRYHESLENLTPADVYFGRAEEVLSQRQTIKEQTLLERRAMNQLSAVHLN